jgi:hypothetical protein
MCAAGHADDAARRQLGGDPEALEHVGDDFLAAAAADAGV